MAKDASIIAVQVFTKFTGEDCESAGSDPCVLTYPSDQIAALEFIYQNRSSYDIASANMSLGGDRFEEPCSTDPRADIVNNLRSAGIATIASSGNDGFTEAMGAPACIPSVVSVGSTEDGSLGTTVDEVSSFSNSADFLDLLAPGEVIESAVPGGSYEGKNGTSMAAPHVAGAWAVYKSKNPGASVSQVHGALAGSGVQVPDSRNGITKPRLRIDRALQTASWLAFEPASGTLAPSDSRSVQVTADASGLSADTYTETLEITSNDPDEDPVEVTVDLTVEDDTPPTASDDSDQTTEGQSTTTDVLANDSDSDGGLDPSSVQVESGPSNGSASANDDGTITYTPSSGFTGTDSYKYTVADKQRNRSGEATVTIEVKEAPGDRPPIALEASSPQQPGSEFWVDVRVGSESNNVQDLNQVGFDLSFEQQHLSHVGDEAGSFLGDVQYASDVDSENGIVSIGATRTDDEGRSGSGVVARVRLALGQDVADGTELTFSVQNVQAEDPGDNSIDLNPQDLDVTVQAGIMVWPGDMDDNGEVDQFDLFPIGDYWGETGPPRAEEDQGCEWRKTTAQPWTPEEVTHADANGDGEVNQFDIFCLGDNWGKTQGSGTAAPASATASAAGKENSSHSRTERLVLDISEAEERAVWVAVKAREVKNLLGFGTELAYPAENWEVQQVEPAAWLGEDLLTQTRIEAEAGRVAVGISRKGTGRSGSGLLVRLKLRPLTSAEETARTDLLDNVQLVESAGRTAGGYPVDFQTKKSASLKTPEQLVLDGGHPNPVRSSATIEYGLPEDQHVRLAVFDMLGRRVATLVDRRQTAGRKTVSLNVSAEGLSSGTYFLRLTAAGQMKTSRITVVR